MVVSCSGSTVRVHALHEQNISAPQSSDFLFLEPCLVSLSLGLALGLKAIALGVSDPKAWLFVFIVAFF